MPGGRIFRPGYSHPPPSDPDSQASQRRSRAPDRAPANRLEILARRTDILQPSFDFPNAARILNSLQPAQSDAFLPGGKEPLSNNQDRPIVPGDRHPPDLGDGGSANLDRQHRTVVEMVARAVPPPIGDAQLPSDIASPAVAADHLPTDHGFGAPRQEIFDFGPDMVAPVGEGIQPLMEA